MTDPNALASARQLLAETEAQAAAGLGGPYVRGNLESQRRRVARLEASMPAVRPVAVATAVTIATAAKTVPAPKPRSREEAIRFIAANAPVALPEGMAAQAIETGQTAGAFAVAVADHVLAARAEQEREAEIERLVAEILAS